MVDTNMNSAVIIDDTRLEEEEVYCNRSQASENKCNYKSKELEE
jgi:hypothetical protein